MCPYIPDNLGGHSTGSSKTRMFCRDQKTKYRSRVNSKCVRRLTFRAIEVGAARHEKKTPGICTCNLARAKDDARTHTSRRVGVQHHAVLLLTIAIL